MSKHTNDAPEARRKLRKDIVPYREAIQTEDGLELRDIDGLTVATISGVTPEAERLITEAPMILLALIVANGALRNTKLRKDDIKFAKDVMESAINQVRRKGLV